MMHKIRIRFPAQKQRRVMNTKSNVFPITICHFNLHNFYGWYGLVTDESEAF